MMEIKYNAYCENMSNGFETMTPISHLERSSNELAKTLETALFLICKKRLLLASKRIELQQCAIPNDVNSLSKQRQRKTMASASKISSYSVSESQNGRVELFSKNRSIQQAHDCQGDTRATEKLEDRKLVKQKIGIYKERRTINNVHGYPSDYKMPP